MTDSTNSVTVNSADGTKSLNVTVTLSQVEISYSADNKLLCSFNRVTNDVWIHPGVFDLTAAELLHLD